MKTLFRMFVEINLECILILIIGIHEKMTLYIRPSMMEEEPIYWFICAIGEIKQPTKESKNPLAR